MAELTLNGVAVLEATITLPRLGRWHAELVLDTADQVRGAATLAAADARFRLVGTIARGGGYEDRGRVALVGGADGLATALPALYYRHVPGRLPLTDLLRACGERLSPTSNAPGLDRELPFWTRLAGAANVALMHLLDALGGIWRVLPDGGVFVGTETWPTADVDPETMDADPSDARAELAFDEVPAGLLPGTLFQDQRVSVVTHVVRAAGVRTVVDFERAGAATDRSADATEQVIRRAVREVSYHALHPARVVAQGADGSVDLTLQPDLQASERTFPPMTGVPMRSFAPGILALLPAGSRCLVGFADGSPAAPYACLWDTGATNLSGLKIGANAARGAARLDDSIDPGTLAVAFVPGTGGATLTLTYTPPGGPAQIVSGVGGTLTLGGRIDSASAITSIE